MSDYDDTNTISLWKNDVGDNPKRPILRGTVNIEGTEYKVSLWKRNSDNPKAPVFGGAVEPADSNGSASSSSDDDIGF